MDGEKLLDNLAVQVSRIFHPFVLAIPTGMLLLYLAELSIVESVKWVLLSAAVTILPTTLFMRFHPDYRLRDINSREKRNLLYLIAVTELIILTGLSYLLNAPETVMVYLYSAVILTSVGALINRFSKISLHVGFLSSFSTAVSFLSIQLGALFYAMTLTTAWSRLRMDRHTFRQLLLGVFIPIICIGPIFYFLL